MKFRLKTVKDFYSLAQKEEIEELDLGFMFQKTVYNYEPWQISNEPEIELETLEDLMAFIAKVKRSVHISTDLPPDLMIVNDYF